MINSKNHTLVWQVWPNFIDNPSNLNSNCWIFYDQYVHKIKFMNIPYVDNKIYSFFNSDWKYPKKSQIDNDDIVFLEVTSYDDSLYTTLLEIIKIDHPTFLTKNKLNIDVFIDNIEINNFNIQFGDYNIFRLYGGKLIFQLEKQKDNDLQTKLNHKVDLFYNTRNSNFNNKNDKLNLVDLFENKNYFSFEYFKVFKTHADFENFYTVSKSFINSIGIANGTRIIDENYETTFIKIALRFNYVENQKISVHKHGSDSTESLEYFKQVVLQKISLSNDISDAVDTSYCPDTTYEDNLSAFEGDMEAYNLWQNE